MTPFKPFFCPVASFNEPDKAHSEMCLHSGLHLLTFVLTLLQQSSTYVRNVRNSSQLWI